ncbi:hypothetical protein [Mycobacteroides abscessus]|uniref:hypothetical protein n=1 Tax=Mycobacteroides abscessus TaxID=36809 RepID=UPI00189698DD
MANVRTPAFNPDLADLPSLTVPRLRSFGELALRLDARAAAALSEAEISLELADHYRDDRALMEFLIEDAKLYLAEFHAIGSLRVTPVSPRNP